MTYQLPPRLVPLVIVAGIVVVGGIGYAMRHSALPLPGHPPVACTMEARQCPDGSYVGRTGPHCAFAPCPSPSSQACGSSYGQCATGFRCIEKCGPPVARDTDPPPGYYCERNAIADQPRNCPICLAANTDIATPNGAVNVRDVRVGMQVWSLDEHGQKVASPVVRVSHTLVPPTHRVIHLVLTDGRAVWVSPNHPTVAGTPVARLQIGDPYDGAKVRSTELVAYHDDATYDILPDSGTGMYWANEILLRSTLK